MLKKLFTAALFLVMTSTANATLMTGIDGTFTFVGDSAVSLDAVGHITEINFVPGSIIWNVAGDYVPYLAKFDGINLLNPVLTAGVVGQELWSAGGFSFMVTDVIENFTANSASGLKIIGEVSHVDFTTTTSEWFFSTQNLTLGDTVTTTFSAEITSPVPEPGTLAIFALGLVGFGLSRKKKSA